MFDKFGNFNSVEELNKTAEGLKNEGDTESLKTLSIENGLDPEDAQDYIDGFFSDFCGPVNAAIGKLEVESKEIDVKGLWIDWVTYIKAVAIEDKQVAIAVRKKSKSLAGCIARIMEKSYKMAWDIPKEIIAESKITAQGVKFGVPSMAECKEIIREYYTEA